MSPLQMALNLKSKGFLYSVLIVIHKDHIDENTKQLSITAYFTFLSASL